MGLDSVELLLAIEEEFGLDIPDVDAEEITTVGNVYDYLRMRLKSVPAESCLTQRVFYKVRRALMQNFGMKRANITPDTRLREFLTPGELAEGWPFMQVFAELKFPEFEQKYLFGLLREDQGQRTLRELVYELVQRNRALLSPIASDDEVWARLVSVIVQQLNVRIQDIKPEASFARDLGVD